MSTIIYKTINQKWSVQKGYHNAKLGSNVMSVSVQNLDRNLTEKTEVNVTGAITVVLPTNVTGVRTNTAVIIIVVIVLLLLLVIVSIIKTPRLTVRLGTISLDDLDYLLVSFFFFALLVSSS